MNALDRSSYLLRNDLELFNKKFKEKILSQSTILNFAIKYILRLKSKKIRPILVFLTAKACDNFSERTYTGAILVELLHTATLIHDDVVDNADKRRGMPSINYIWRNKIAVLIGDYFLSKGLLISIENKDYDYLNITADAVKRMAEGELLQIAKTKKFDIDIDTYYKIISDKTASLISACCKIGASGAKEEYFKAMQTYGENIGIAFQIVDDILDYAGAASIFGKAIGKDLKEKKITLPLICALKNSTPAESKIIKRMIIADKKNKMTQAIINFVIEKNGVEDAFKIANQFRQKAIEALEYLPDSEFKDALKDLAEYIVSRKK
jgi:octaprenyl-diphosphate synthase